MRRAPRAPYEPRAILRSTRRRNSNLVVVVEIIVVVVLQFFWPASLEYRHFSLDNIFFVNHFTWKNFLYFYPFSADWLKL